MQRWRVRPSVCRACFCLARDAPSSDLGQSQVEKLTKDEKQPRHAKVAREWCMPVTKIHARVRRKTGRQTHIALCPEIVNRDHERTIKCNPVSEKCLHIEPLCHGYNLSSLKGRKTPSATLHGAIVRARLADGEIAAEGHHCRQFQCGKSNWVRRVLAVVVRKREAIQRAWERRRRARATPVANNALFARAWLYCYSTGKRFLRVKMRRMCAHEGSVALDYTRCHLGRGSCDGMICVLVVASVVGRVH